MNVTSLPLLLFFSSVVHRVTLVCVNQNRYVPSVPGIVVSPQRTTHSRAGASSGNVVVAGERKLSMAWTKNAAVTPAACPGIMVEKSPAPLFDIATVV